MTVRIVVADAIHRRGLDTLRPDFEVIQPNGDPERLKDALRDADALLVRSATRVTEPLMAAAPRLRVIGRAGIGVDNIDVEAATRRGIAVLNAPGANTVSAAEHTIAILLSLVRKVPWAANSMRDGEWNRAGFGGTELRGKSLGLIGLGRVGVHVAGIAQAFGMRVAAYDPFLPEARARELRVTLLPLDDVIRTADVISLHAPLTNETHRLLNEARLAQMKPSAVVVNTARGALIDTDALVEALERGRVAGAALDVFDEEPLPPDSPLRRCDKLLLTPHLAASTEEAQERVAVEICASVRKALETGDVGGAVNVPGVSDEALARARDVMDLARRIGRLAGHVAKGRVSAVEVYYGGDDDEAARPVMLGALEGVLQSMGVGQVSLVNAAILADERQITTSRRIGRPFGGFERSVGVKLKTQRRVTTVVGVLSGGEGAQGRIMEIDGFAIDIPARGPIVILRNRDVPGVIGHVGTVLGAAHVNIAYYHQSRSDTGGDALAAIAVDQPPAGTVLDELRRVPDVLEVRLADLNGTGLMPPSAG